MADLYLQAGTESTVNPPLGFGLLGHNVGVTQVTESIIIQAEKQFTYYNKTFTTALDSGVISQSLYDDIVGNQDESRQVYEIESNLIIGKQLLIDLVNKHNIQNVDTAGGTAAEIVEDIINEGLMIVKRV
jgi:hypothetical protein